MWLAAARWPPAVVPPFTSTTGLRRGDGAQPFEERAAVGDAFDVREAHRGRVVVGVPVEVVGDADRGRVAGGHRAADADAGLRRPVLERRHEVARLARDRDAAGGRVRRDDLRAQRGRRRHDALAVRAREQDAELVGERDQLALGARGRRRPPRRSPRW